MNPLTDFIQTTLYPALFDRANMAFPELGLKQYRGGWATPCKLDGTQSHPYRQDKSVITRNHPTRILEQGGDSKDLLSYWMERNNQTSTFEAVCSLCSAIGIQAPERQTSEEWEKFKAEIETRERHLSAMRKALHTTEQGAQVIDYLKQSRGYTEQYITKLIEWGIGVITPEIASQMGDAIPRSLQMDKHLLAIPYRNRDRLLGFTFRDVTGSLGGGDKYRFTFGLAKKANLFGLSGLRLTGNKEKDRTLTIVEGQLDALHAQLEGLENVVATGGVNISTEALTEAKKMGVERVVLILDTEDTPEKNAQRDKDRAKALRTIHSAGLEGFIVTLPSDDGAKTDVDSYLNTHTIEELEAVIEGNESAALFIYRLIEEEALAKFQAQKQQDKWDERNVSDFRKAVLAHLSDPITRPIDRDLIYKQVSDFSSGTITATALQEEAEAIIAVENAKRQTEETKRIMEQASTLAKAGKPEEALELVSKELPKLREINRDKEFSKYLNTPPFGQFANLNGGTETPYYFWDRKNENPEQLILPSGALSIIAAPTSHGKSTMLRNLALHTAKNGAEGAVLYFTLEESLDNLKIQFATLNSAPSLPFISNNYFKTIQAYKLRKSLEYFAHTGDLNQTLREVETQLQLFEETLWNTGRLRLYFMERPESNHLIDVISYLCKQIKVKAVFVDYIQKLHKAGYRNNRREELGEISQDFESLALKYGIPIVMGAQVNREALSPLEIANQNIGDSSNIEWGASVIVMLWNSDFKALPKSQLWEADPDKKRSPDQTLIESRGLTLGEKGKMFALLSKNRGGAVGLSSVWTYETAKGIITDTTQPSAKGINATSGAYFQTAPETPITTPIQTKIKSSEKLPF